MSTFDNARAAAYSIEVRPYRAGRLKVEVVRGNYSTAFDISHDEAEALIETLRDALTLQTNGDQR